MSGSGKRSSSGKVKNASKASTPVSFLLPPLLPRHHISARASAGHQCQGSVSRSARRVACKTASTSAPSTTSSSSSTTTSSARSSSSTSASTDANPRPKPATTSTSPISAANGRDDKRRWRKNNKRSSSQESQRSYLVQLYQHNDARWRRATMGNVSGDPRRQKASWSRRSMCICSPSSTR
ncbi:hypothetical protein JOM56_011927 [Amanita muscaria]